ncbi:MAG: cell division protein ZapE [Candidatus Nanopelagicales bacterium]
MRLSERNPIVTTDGLLAGFVPPPQFARVRFDTFRPDPSAPSQQLALDVLEDFAETVVQTQTRPKRRRRRSIRAKTQTAPAGVYLDGGFGVGKTHLLASLWHATPGHRSFGTFVEYTNLVGALGFEQTVEALATNTLVCIDEFELDDPGDTVLMSSLLARLAKRGVKLAATSNTLPDRLGEGRFATEDFMREIQGLADTFESIRIDGDDYRHRGLPQAPAPQVDAEVIAATSSSGSSLDDFCELIDHLAAVHPSRYRALIDGVSTVGLLDVRQLTDQAQALRLVVLVDRLYDQDVVLVTSGLPVDQVFAPDMLVGGYRKKYWRAISRLDALTRG